jgi:methionyl-tRNA formyltransferase
VQGLTEALQGLETAGLKLIVAASDAAPSSAAPGLRRLSLELVGEDRVGIVSQVTTMLAARGVSITSLHTEVVGSATAAAPSFKVAAQLLVPTAQDAGALQLELGTLAQALQLDITLGEGH